ncbi:hypothetical protein EJ08DRAFT_703128 [Tothia fuscella]|uniref:Uncharacterized protein n=1 Tax=Tothia fuscella TaxID=1048955 RepID=A0A9P4TT39_9PEZI|nr:hypothetical protein EJ08DRAFT_703128 [Tothia fuscella]
MLIITIIALIGLSIPASAVSLGPLFWLGPQTMDNLQNYIVEAGTTMQLPAVPGANTMYRHFALWPGMRTDNYRARGLPYGGHLIQTIMSPNGVANQGQRSCKGGERDDQWCRGTSNALQSSRLQINIRYAWNPSTRNTTQYLKVGGGNLISEYTSDSGRPFNWHVTVECWECVGTTPEHSYLDTTIKLQNAEPKFDSWLTTTNVTHSPVTTNDGGKTWHVNWIHVKSHRFG